MSGTYQEDGDWLAAFLVFTRQQDGLLDLMPAKRITGERSEVPVGSHGIVFEKAGGPPGDLSARRATRRLDINIYGPNEFERMRVFRRLSPVLIRPMGLRFEAAGCIVTDVREAAGPVEVPDNEVSDETRLWWSIFADVQEVQVAV